MEVKTQRMAESAQLLLTFIVILSEVILNCKAIMSAGVSSSRSVAGRQRIYFFHYKNRKTGRTYEVRFCFF